MTSYKVPFDITYEEKIIGGYFSIRQTIYLALIVLSIGLFFLRIPLFLSIPIFITNAIICCLFAFLKINGIYFDKYVVYFSKYVKRNKRLIFEK